jgi:hypothetical protein
MTSPAFWLSIPRSERQAVLAWVSRPVEWTTARAVPRLVHQGPERDAGRFLPSR